MIVEGQIAEAEIVAAEEQPAEAGTAVVEEVLAGIAVAAAEVLWAALLVAEAGTAVVSRTEFEIAAAAEE